MNQWTLLVGAVPIAFAISAGGFSGLPIDDRQTQELILTSAQSLLAVLIICDLRFTRVEALALAVLFGGQFMFTSNEVRYLFIGLYLVLSAAMLLNAERRRLFLGLMFSLPHSERKA